MKHRAFFDPATYTLTYVVYDEATRDAVIIDPVLDFDPLYWRTSPTSANEVAAFVRLNDLNVRWILDTHAHADHLSGMEHLRNIFEAPTAIGERITEVQALFSKLYNLGDDVATDGRQWNRLVGDGEELNAGSFSVQALATPGHTPACVSYQIGTTVFTGDTLFMPDSGTGRADFPGGSATDLYHSIKHKLYALPPETRVFTGHDYQPHGRELRYVTSIGESMERNIQLRGSTTETSFVRMRQERDKTLAPPNLILPSLQVNIRAGRLPEPEENGRRYMKMPLNLLGS